ncbi:MAG TPA: alpha/beta fold hydrolase [Xanthobacteraceae bacterium]|nr:alpha/beta fold hydrolase [Xanthobacteraceae bacterium]
MNDRSAESDFRFAAADGYSLAATLRRPAAGPSKGFVLICSATATPRQYYGRFASYLAGRGFSTITFDYRGIGGSKPASLRGFECRMRDWAALDISAAVDFAARKAAATPLLYVGHSYGGQALGLLPNNQKVSRALFVAAQVGYWRLFPPPENWRVWVMLNVGILVAHALGYVPGKLGIGEDLPKGVFLEWAKWCMSPNYLFDDQTLEARKYYPNYHGALRGIGMADDTWAPPVAIEKLLAGYTGTRPEHVTVVPTAIGEKKIGHFGYFRQQAGEKLWPAAGDWLEGKS